MLITANSVILSVPSSWYNNGHHLSLLSSKNNVVIPPDVLQLLSGLIYIYIYHWHFYAETIFGFIFRNRPIIFVEA